MADAYGLIADIGGTNARFALAPLMESRSGTLLEGLVDDAVVAEKTLAARDFPGFDEALAHYLDSIESRWGRPRDACMAVACPTDSDIIRLTNNAWTFSVSALGRQFGFRTLRFINDYHALASALPYLDAAGTVAVGGGAPRPGGTMAVTGPGTGLGLSALVFGAGRPLAVQTEGGHAHFAPTDDLEADILAFLRRELPRVSWERLLSGMGLENLYRALAALHGSNPPALAAPEITRQAEAGDALCAQTLDRFCAILGSYTGDVALMYGASGGVYIAGGIVPRFLGRLQASEFRQRFEDKARFADYNRAIPTHVITARQPGLLGAAAELNYQYQQRG